MMDKYRVAEDKLKSTFNMDAISFETTEELEPLEGIIGQERAANALDFGLEIKKMGYNIYVSGLSGTGRNSYVRLMCKRKASTQLPPQDWVYVYNFKESTKPIALSFSPGEGKRFRDEIEWMIKGLKKEIENAFVSKNYESMKSVLFKQYDDESENLINKLNAVAEKFDFKFIQTDRGLISMPVKDGEVMKEEDYKTLTRTEYEELRERGSSLALETVDVLNEIKDLEEEYQDQLKKLENEIATKIIELYVTRTLNKFKFNNKLLKYFDMLREDIIEHISMFKDDESDSNNPLAILQGSSSETFFKRYHVNLFIDNSGKQCAPVIIENNPTYKNLIGSIDYKSEMGVAKTDFMFIKSGTLHQANGGYIILQAMDVLSNPFAWAGLLRTLTTNQITIEGVEANYGFASPIALKPEPIPLDIKVILIGSPYIHLLLFQHDEKFRKLFKVTADFDTQMSNTNENIVKMARFIAAQCKKEKLKHFDKYAVSKVVEYSFRLTSDQNKLSSRFNKIADIIFEAEAWANKESSGFVGVRHIDKAIKEKNYRNNQYEEKLLEMFKSGDILLDIDGEKIGIINGLAVLDTGEYSFGKPSKISVSTYQGRAGLINIEREVKNSGHIHDKGVMIINGYLGHKYAQDHPLALSASIVFEQLYSGVDGDSASSTELYAILSSLSEVPIKQHIAVTGSVNQRGEIQPIGGVNEKIEGFFKVCRQKGLTGQQGVMIPHQNVKNLMLSDEVIAAINLKKFNVYSVKDIDEGLEILTGIPAGKKGEDDQYPKGSIHYLVNEKLKKYSKAISKTDEQKKINI